MDSTLDIDKIWDEPIVQKRMDRTNEQSDDSEERPSKRPRQTLFLADSDDESESISTMKLKVPPAHDINIDALFADVEDDIDEEMTFKPLPPALNEEELHRQAEARYRKELPPLTPQQVLPSNSSQRDTMEKSGNTRPRAGKDGQTKDEKKERRRLAKLDENRLLSPNGFPQLMKMTKDFRIKGKGHEATDLHRLLQVYQYWTHQLYPKTQFRDTIERVEKLCHSRRMHVSLSVWRDEAHGRFNRSNAHEDDEGTEDGDNVNGSRTEHSDPDLPPPSSLQASSTELSRPMTDTESNSRETRVIRIQGIDFDGDDEVSRRSLAADVLQKVSMSSTTTNTAMDQDQDMWDIVNELEREGETPSAVAHITQPVIPELPGRPFDPGDDWDDMYL